MHQQLNVDVSKMAEYEPTDLSSPNRDTNSTRIHGSLPFVRNLESNQEVSVSQANMK